LSVDPLASDFVSLSPYSLVANNPIKFVDVDGRDIIVTRISGGGENGKDLILITINARIVDKTTISSQIAALKAKDTRRKKGLNKRDRKKLNSLLDQQNYIRNEMASDVRMQLEVALTGKGENVDWKFDVSGSSIAFADDPTQIPSNANVLYAVDIVYSGEKTGHDYNSKVPEYDNRGGRAVLGGLAAYFAVGLGVEQIEPDRLYAHEPLHNSGLVHPEEMYNYLRSIGAFSGSLVQFEKMYGFEANVMLMGDREDGELILNESQVLQIEKLFNQGMLNLGDNSYDPQHALNADQNRIKNKKEYYYDPGSN
ncbi:hypothetical protein KC799_08040, partial [candidate division KSB1 bacterium]|nr:hypothetical protein [candidate division KSB1 bacterium]